MNYCSAVTVYDCPTVRYPAVNSGGASGSTNHFEGIGMNAAAGKSDPNYSIGTYLSRSPSRTVVKESQVLHPADTVIFGDTGNVLNPPVPTRANVDSWVDLIQPPNGSASCLLRVGGPSDPSTTPLPDTTATAMPRHNKRLNCAFVDGHSEAIKNSQFGLGLLATDPGAKWSIAH